ncbi:hypothetical protein SODALDRAFT_192265 [Sodiomyces alkalinus F11]|uniref:Uncharacterized protein n=1 Tax=Sodiomyces alkalinus (strain CBS 110278 / VKM F-3762 / F11) TaxID=1314773 RepID=A0A3N2PSD1_SODAK|nr:hypothetical protein SODALDRAFT_192265 [Sodiomyces alkalinus F11]ROT37236.1 hypothetical protein SODALDRAFT_192265 [Sodiomyces alkalinus F11]
MGIACSHATWPCACFQTLHGRSCTYFTMAALSNLIWPSHFFLLWRDAWFLGLGQGVDVPNDCLQIDGYDQLPWILASEVHHG